jgi:hypothetical protein
VVLFFFLLQRIGVYLFVDLLAHERNEYLRFFSADINHILAASPKGLYNRVCEHATPRFAFCRLNVTLISIFNFTVLLFHRVIRVFLV